MILPNPDFESPTIIRVNPANDLNKVLAFTAIELLGATPLHCKIVKKAKIEGKIQGFDINHTVLGYISQGPIVGKTLFMVRYNTAGRDAYGVFETSMVTEVTPIDNGFDFVTQNSFYRLEYITDPLSP